MDKQAQYIKSIEIDALWSNGKHILWELRPGVNILSGSNGVGKSTIIKRSAAHLKIMHDRHVTRNPHEGVNITFYPEDASIIPFDVISSVDRPLISSELMDKISGADVHTELDWQLYQLQRRYLDYQVNIGNRIIELLSSADPDGQRKAAEVSYPKRRFQDLADELFSETGKKIIRSKNEIVFEQDGEELLPYKLSSGEKQMLVILLTVLVQDKQPCILLMDEPEISLHIEWQQRVIEIIREMNPYAQIILTTHSPAMIMGGWMDAVTEVTDITIHK